jgi:hypothetical protein
MAFEEVRDAGGAGEGVERGGKRQLGDDVVDPRQQAVLAAHVAKLRKARDPLGIRHPAPEPLLLTDAG